MLDVVLNNGLVIDPRNRIMSVLNVGIAGGKIVCVTRDTINGAAVYDCGELVVTPGFVDAHAHEDPYDKNKREIVPAISHCLLAMGVTTFVGGNCGNGPESLREYLAALDRAGHPVNVAMLSAHGSLRNRFGTFNKYGSVDDATIGQMAGLLADELEAGAVGLSFGVRYVPGMDYREMAALCIVVNRFGGVVTAHVRDDADKVIPALEEMVRLSRDSGAKLQISHIGSMAAYGQMRAAYRFIDDCAARGLDIGVDCYPYNAFCTAIGSATYDDGFLERYGIDYSRIMITEGKYKGQPCTAASFQEERAKHPEYLTVAHVMREAEVDMALAHPRTLVGSDGILHDGNGHPRLAGTFPRILREYVIKKKILTLYDAVDKMTSRPAVRFALDKGSLSPGADADVTVFDMKSVCDTASFANPMSRPEGIKYVFIGGQLACKDGQILRDDLGKSVRRQ